MKETHHGSDLSEEADKQKNKPFSCELLYIAPEELLITRTDTKYEKGECLCLATLGDENEFGRATCSFVRLIWDSENRCLIGICKYNNSKIILTPKGWESRR